MTISLGDVIAIAMFVFQAGVSYAVLRQHGRELKAARLWREDHADPLLVESKMQGRLIQELRDWKHKEVTGQIGDLKLRVGLLEERDTPA